MSATFDAKQKSNLLCFCSCFLVNSADRVIRVYESGEVLACGKNGEPEPIQKLQDLVNKYVFYLRLTRHKNHEIVSRLSSFNSRGMFGKIPVFLVAV